jgi:uroporphyrinogen decarboxylase
MNSRQRLQTVLKGKIPDHVPVAPDTSNMIPARLTGKPFWDLYLYNDPPIWKAYIDCVKYFGFDSLMDGHARVYFEDLGEIDRESVEYIVSRQPDKIITQNAKRANGKMFWSDKVRVYNISNPPSFQPPEKVHLPAVPDKWEKVEGQIVYPQGSDLLAMAKNEMGDHGLVGVFCGTTLLLGNEDDVYEFYDNPGKYEQKRDELLNLYEKKFFRLMALEQKPDFLCVGASGTLIFQTVEIFRKLALPIVKRITALCREYGIPSHAHSCGPETALVKIMAEETDLTSIDPLEIPPMGDCDLGKLKKLYGNKLVLKGNLHTTDVMLRGSVQDVRDACKRAIDAAAENGRFILSTVDQCGRDTPFENIFAMVETAETYGRY